MTYPDKFHFINSLADNKFTLHREEDPDLGTVWRCSSYNEEPKGWEAVYTQRQLSRNFESGLWKRIEEERPLKLPAKVRVGNGDYGTVYATGVDGYVLLISPITGTTAFCESFVRNAIKNGAWIVVEPPQESVEAPTSNESTASDLSLKVDTKDAQNSVKELAELLGVAIERAAELEAVMKRLNGRE